MFLLTLRFYATGGFQETVGDIFSISKSSASRAITSVTHHIAMLRDKFINMPCSPNERKKVQADFYKVAKFPRVIGAMDCTHIKICSPGGDDAELFRNRKGFFSFNVQTLCDSNLRMLDIVARWQGSAHDSRIYRNSRINYRFENGEFGNALIVADSGYENNNIVVTPLSKCTNDAENLYNESHIRTRNCVERSYGVWKRRFPILSMGIRMKLCKVPAIIVATAVMHNICCQNNEMAAPPLHPSIEQAVMTVLAASTDNNTSTVQHQKEYTRRTLIQTHFATL